jgi:nucleoid DNA-binding protein
METLVTYIEEFIYLHDQVVIPGLGTFVGRHESATVKGGTITPPSTTVLFNKHPRQDDGLLAAWIARREGTSTREARARVSRFRESLLERLGREGRVALGTTGVFRLDRKGGIAFEPSPGGNLPLDTTGLLPLALPASPTREDAAGEYLHAGSGVLARLFRYGLSAAVITGIVVISRSGLFQGEWRGDGAAMHPAPAVQERVATRLPVVVSPAHDFVDYTPSL